MGTLLLPSNQRLMTIDGQRLAVLVRDSLDVESIMVLRINTGAP